MIEGEPWFHAKDVCDCLGLSMGRQGADNNIRHISPEDKCLITPDRFRGLRGLGATFISESGLYKLIMRSDKPEAMAFQDWVTIETALAPVDHQGAQMIDARALHGWLGNKDPFHQWMRRRINEYAFEEGSDFCTNLFKTKGRPRADYFLTINMAKELAMVERTPIGQMTRRYFIKMEEAALERGFLPNYLINYQRKFSAPDALG